MKTLAGVFPVVSTTFRDDGSLDLESQIRLVHHLLEAGAHGLALFGMAGEGYALSDDERRTLLKLIRREAGDEVPLVVAAGHTGQRAAAENCRQAEDLGADAVMVLPPYLLRPGEDGVFRFFEAISEAVRIPIVVQDAPLVTQVSMSPALVARMLSQIERVRYAKIEAPPTAPKMSAILRQAPGAALFSGLNGQFLIEEHERGACGVMPNSDMIPQFVRIWRLLEAGDREGAWRRFVHILPLIRYELQPALGVSAAKHSLAARGVIRSPRVRPPTAELDAQGLRELEHLRRWVDEGAPPEEGVGVMPARRADHA
ncbi:MAG: dihydrodipicolinate synthase family protein [Bryobacteraceae bacterium]